MKKPVEAQPVKTEVFEPAAVAARLKKWFPELSASTIQALVDYEDDLLTTNKTLSLIPSNSLKSVDSTHLADSILGSRLIEPKLVKGEPVYDLAGGSGAPGLIFALLYPAHKVVIADRDSRKLEFCKRAAGAMGLKNVTTLNKSTEEIPASSVKNAISRGPAAFARTLLVFRKQMPKGGKLFHMKGDGWANELAQMPSQLFTHWSPSLLGQYRLPDSQVDMYVVLTDKSGD